MMLPGCCLRALKPFLFCLGVIALATPLAAAPLFTCEAGSGTAGAEATVAYVDTFGAVFDLDLAGKPSRVVRCEGGTASASAAARFLWLTGTGQSTFSLAINADSIVMSGNSSGTG